MTEAATRCFLKNYILKNFAKFTVKHVLESPFKSEGQQLYQKETPAQVFSCKF